MIVAVNADLKPTVGQLSVQSSVDRILVRHKIPRRPKTELFFQIGKLSDAPQTLSRFNVVREDEGEVGSVGPRMNRRDPICERTNLSDQAGCKGVGITPTGGSFHSPIPLQ